MAKSYSREDIISCLQTEKGSGRLLVMGGAGIGLSAKCEEIGGADLLLFDAPGYYRMDGRPSLAGFFGYREANDIVREMSRRMLGVVNEVPVIAGVSAADPFCDVDMLIGEYLAAGFSGVANSPSVGCFEENEQANLDKTGMGYLAEVDMIRRCHERSIFTAAFCWNKRQAISMADAGADIIIFTLGACVGGFNGVPLAPDIDTSIEEAKKVANALEGYPDTLLFCHGGVLTESRIVERFLREVPRYTGFYGGSAIERLPMERAMVERGEEFKNTRLSR